MVETELTAEEQQLLRKIRNWKDYEKESSQKKKMNRRAYN